MKKIIIFIIFLLLALSFILFNKGFWLYIDTSYFPTTLSRSIEYFYASFSTIGFSGFGFDSTQIVSTRFLQEIIDIILGQRILYILFFVLSFWSAYVLLSEKFDKNNSFYGALFFTFNPISLYFLSEVGFIFAYFSLPLIVFSVYRFFVKKKYIYLLFSLLGFLFLLSYTRLIGIYFAFGFLLFLYFFAFVKKQFLENTKNVLIFIFSHIIFFLPFLFSFIFPYLNGDKAYFSGLGNYVDASSGIAEGFYHGMKNDPMSKGFVITEILGNTGANWYNSNIFQIFSIIFILGIIIATFFVNHKIQDKFIKFLSYSFLIFLSLRIFAKIVPFSVFDVIVYKYFPFIANNLNWVYLFYIPIIAICIVFLLSYANKIQRKIVISGVFAYSFLAIIPFLPFVGNEKLGLVDLEKIPENYQKTFYNGKIERNNTLLFPASVYFSWSPYVIEMFNNSIYQSIFIGNIRQVNSKQVSLNNKVGESFHENLFLFNLKNVFVFKDVKNAKEGQFDFFEVKDYEKESQEYYDFLQSNNNLYVKQDNENFAKFGLKHDDKYEYFLYSPAKIEKYSMEEFFSEKNSINIFEKPVNIDENSFNKPKGIENFEIPEENQNISIRYKKSLLQPTKIYAKFGNIDTSKPFLVQLNQTFGMSWKLKSITKDEFEEKKCLDDYREFEITQNKFCNYKPQILDLADTKFLDNPEIPNSQHFEGNFVGNTWLVKPENIPENMKNSNEIYAVIIYEKQIWYNWALLILGLTFGFLIILMIFQEIKNFKNRKNEK